MILERVEQMAAGLTRSERRVAEFVLDRPNVVARSSINYIAETVGVSEPTVIRFCRTVGLKGFQDLKQAVARDLGRLAPVVRRAGEDEGPGAGGRLLDRLLAAVLDLQQSLDRETLGRAGARLAAAGRVEIWAAPGFAGAAADAAEAFRAAGFACAAGEAAGAARAARWLGASDAVILVGEAADGGAAADALEAGAYVLAVRPAGGPAPAAASDVLTVDRAAEPLGGPSSVSRLAAAAVLDLVRIEALARRAADRGEAAEVAADGEAA